MDTKKRFLSWLMAVVMVIGMSPSWYAIADEGDAGTEAGQEVTTPAPAEGEGGGEDATDPVDVPVQDPVEEPPAVEDPVEVVQDPEPEVTDPVPAEEGEQVDDPAVETVTEDPAEDEEVLAEEQVEAEGEEDPEEEAKEEEEEGDEEEEEEDVELEEQADYKASVSYSAHVQNIGWQSAVKDGKTAGTSGRALRVEAFKIKVKSDVKGGIRYSAHVQNIGWQDYVADGALCGTSGRALRVEALKIELTGNLAKKFDVYYRLHIQNYGWLDWASNGAPAGSEGMALRVEAVQIKLVKKGEKAPGSTASPFKSETVGKNIMYSAHVENVGWQSYVSDGEVAGTSGRALRVEALKIKLGQGISGGVSYSAHVQNVGWQDFVSNGEVSGTSGRSLRVEAVKIKLTGAAAKNYDVYYRAHVQNYGWLDWACNGAAAGSEGLALRVEAVQIQLVSKGAAAPGATAKPCAKPTVSYKVYKRGVGWSGLAKDGATAGTTGQALPLEGLNVSVSDLGVSGSVFYSTHMQNIGWTSEVGAGKTAGKVNSALRMEAIKVRLSGTASKTWDIYYRAHAANFGWLGWAKNGAPAGTEGYGYALEAVEIKLVRKGGSAPGSTSRAFVSYAGQSSNATLKMTLDQMASWQPPYTNGVSVSTVRSLLDPANSKKGTAKYYQFANLDGYSGLSAAQIDAFINSTSAGRNGKLRGHGLDFVAASKKYGVNECYLLAHAIIESGWGTSDLASGFRYNGKTYYNFYGIGAYDGNALSGGRGAAVKYGWSSPSLAIMGAAEFISENYVYGSPYKQNTLYNMKWDYLRSNDTMARGWHQYASDPYWPTSIAGLMDECYRYNGFSPSLSYTVPKYK